MSQAVVTINEEADEELSVSLGEMLDREKLWQFCQAFIDKQNIHCAETICQTDRVIENAYEFIDGVCKIVGFKKDEDEE
ncbi:MULTISPECIES: hypothetical protein [unclassified Ensifer]|uniref:hypothetical protein n=1 Tax=unclassified Ensifer TaxID=2633371 RepID=UPI0008133096|nr:MULTISPECIES: hypothetical protein [unclassified Ensifer]OCP21999.1 hypothetical protein BC361_25885 [Ensifer sp. LC54]OCP23221.1 hypothetical protein BC363_24880 [Ensifer sp. LC384]